MRDTIQLSWSINLSLKKGRDCDSVASARQSVRQTDFLLNKIAVYLYCYLDGIHCSWIIRGCLHDDGATFIPGRDETLHCVYIQPCLLGCESYSAVKLMKL